MAVQSSSSSFARAIITVVMLLNTAIAGGGVLFGWSSIVVMLDEEGQFKSLSEKDRTAKYNLIFTLGANMLSIASVVFGITLDIYGPLINSLIGAALCAGGYVLLALASDTFDVFIPAILLISFGGIGVYLPHFPFGNMYKSYSTMIVSAISGAFTASGLNWFLLRLISDKYGITRKSLFLGYAAAVGVVFLSILLLYPLHTFQPGERPMLGFRTWFGGQLRARAAQASLDFDSLDPSANPSDYNSQLMSDLGNPEIPVEKITQAELEASLLDEADRAAADKPEMSLVRTLFSPACIWMSFYFSFFLLVIAYYTASIADQLKEKGDTSGNYNTAFLLVFNLLPLPLSAGVGWLINNYGYWFATAVSTVLAIGSFGVLFIPALPTAVISFTLLAGTRSLLFAIMFSYVGVAFPGLYYGKIVGVITFAAAVIGSAQIGLSRLAIYTFDSYTPVNIMFLVLTIPFLYYSFWLRRRKE